MIQHKNKKILYYLRIISKIKVKVNKEFKLVRNYIFLNFSDAIIMMYQKFSFLLHRTWEFFICSFFFIYLTKNTHKY